MRRRRATGGGWLRLFVAADIHGAEVCFRKFINAAGFYQAEALVLGGDITGKALVPLTRQPDARFRLVFMGREHLLEEGPELDEAEKLIRFNGFYPYRCTPSEQASLSADPTAVTGAFEVAMREQVSGWVTLADDRLTDARVRCFAMPGNDDFDFVSDVLADGQVLHNHDGRTLEVDGHRIVGYGWSNPTPWTTPREKPEEEIERDLRALLEDAGDTGDLIFNPHVPPYDSGLDLAPELKPDLSMVLRGGQPNYVPVGSRAVRRVIEDYQPMLALTGHIHESRGVTRIGRTVCVNPGSEYNAGRLLGAIVEVRRGEVGHVQLVTG